MSFFIALALKITHTLSEGKQYGGKSMRVHLLGLIVTVFISGCSDKPLQNMTEMPQISKKHHVKWNTAQAKPDQVVSTSGKVVLRPCSVSDESHKNLFVQLYTQHDSVKMYLDGAVRTQEEALTILDSHAARWDEGLLLSGFVGYSPNNIPFVHCGIGLFPAKHVAEVFILELPVFRGKGLGKEVMSALNNWAGFLKDLGPLAFGSTNKPGIYTLIARVSPENTASLKLFLGAGFTTDFSLDDLKKEFGDYQPSNGKIIDQTLQIEGKTIQVKVLTTQRRPTPKVILIKRL